MNTPVLLSRRELYNLVWSKPMRDLAAEFGISDVGLAKICDRHRVPKPQRGHWAKVAAGTKVKQAIFVEVNDAQLDRVEIRGLRTTLPEEARHILDAARAQHARPRRLRAPRAPVVPSAVAPVVEVHATLAPTARKMRAVHAPPGGAARAFGNGLCGIDVAVEQVERVIAFLDDLARRLENKALPIQPTGQAMKVARGADEAIFTLKERIRHEKHVPTEAEITKEEKQKRKSQHGWQSKSAWDIYHRPSHPEFDTIYSGEFVLQVEGYGDGIRRRWADGRTQTVESLVDQIVVGIESLLAVRKAEREKREEWERQYQELKRRRALAEKRQKREERRIGYLRQLSDLQRETERLRDWLALVDRQTIEAYPDLRRMVTWTRVRLAELAAAGELPGIDRDLREQGLFPEVDELLDPLGDPDEPEDEW